MKQQNWKNLDLKNIKFSVGQALSEEEFLEHKKRMAQQGQEVYVVTQPTTDKSKK